MGLGTMVDGEEGWRGGMRAALSFREEAMLEEEVVGADGA